MRLNQRIGATADIGQMDVDMGAGGPAWHRRAVLARQHEFADARGERLGLRYDDLELIHRQASSNIVSTVRSAPSSPAPSASFSATFISRCTHSAASGRPAKRSDAPMTLSNFDSPRECVSE